MSTAGQDPLPDQDPARMKSSGGSSPSAGEPELDVVVAAWPAGTERRCGFPVLLDQGLGLGDGDEGGEPLDPGAGHVERQAVEGVTAQGRPRSGGRSPSGSESAPAGDPCSRRRSAGERAGGPVERRVPVRRAAERAGRDEERQAGSSRACRGGRWPPFGMEGYPGEAGAQPHGAGRGAGGRLTGGAGTVRSAGSHQRDQS